MMLVVSRFFVVRQVRMRNLEVLLLIMMLSIMVAEQGGRVRSDFEAAV